MNFSVLFLTNEIHKLHFSYQFIGYGRALWLDRFHGITYLLNTSYFAWYFYPLFYCSFLQDNKYLGFRHKLKISNELNCSLITWIKCPTCITYQITPTSPTKQYKLKQRLKY